MKFWYVILCWATVSLADRRSYDGDKVYSVQLNHTNQLAALMRLTKFNVDIWEKPKVNGQPFRVRVPSGVVNTFEGFVGENGVASDVVIEDVSE